MKLSQLQLGQKAIIESVGGSGALRQHFLDMGLVKGVTVSFNKLAPMGDPMELGVRGYELTLRLHEAENIEVELLPDKETEDTCQSTNSKSDNQKISLNSAFHPGFGEGGKYHDTKDNEKELPKGSVFSFALIGNQNSGKTTLFNQLTGSNQHVGNFPGVTVDRKDGKIKGYDNTIVTDLPGIYSLSPYTKEEIVSRDFLLKTRPTGIINIVDATNIERNLYLTMQLMELGTPMVVALNMMDELHKNGGSIDINAMESMLGVPVIPISAAKNEGVDELIEHAVHVARYQEKPLDQDYCDKETHKGAVHRCLHSVMATIEDHAEEANLPLRFAASKVVEGDSLVLDSLRLDTNEQELIEHTIKQMETERGLDASAAIADMRFSFIEKVCKYTVKRPEESREHIRSRKIDRILTGKYTAIPSFILIMALMFYLTFDLIGPIFQNLISNGISALQTITENAFVSMNVAPWLRSLVIDGIFAGVGSVLSFLPIIVILFLFLSLLEDSGYMARVAFVTDKLLRKIGLSGRSIVPLLIGFGCTVPAVMASRTLPSERDRKMTIFLIPFMSCTAKLPIYGFFISAFFSEHRALIMIGLYLFSILLGILTALVFKNTLFKGEAVPFVMELPNYRLPGLKNTAMLVWDKAKDFLTKAFTIIFLASIVIWFLQTFNFKLNMVENSADSILATIAGVIAPVFAPFGCGDWRIVTALIAGFVAKESVVSSLQILFTGIGIATVIGTSGGLALLVFCLLYTPCVAAIGAIRRELGAKLAAYVVIFQCVLAWLMAYVTYLICS